MTNQYPKPAQQQPQPADRTEEPPHQHECRECGSAYKNPDELQVHNRAEHGT